MMLTLEYDCPVDGIDYDLEVAAAWLGQRIYCVGVDVDANVLDDGGRFVRRYVRPGAQDD